MIINKYEIRKEFKGLNQTQPDNFIILEQGGWTGENYKTLNEARERVINFICFPLVRKFHEIL